MRFSFLVYFLLVVLPYCASSQKDTSLSLSKEQWEQLSNEIDYTETYFEQKEEKQKPKTSYVETDASRQYHSDLKYIIYFLALGLIVFLIYLVVKNYNKKNNLVVAKVISVDAMHEIEEKMHEIDLNDVLKEALALKKYRIALRINFLIIIKLLTQKKKIKWAKEKTNWEYYSELKEKLLADKFKEIVISFETVWYGERSLTEMQYFESEPIYKALQKQLKPNE